VWDGTHTRATVAGSLALMLMRGAILAAPDDRVNQALQALETHGLLLDTQRLEQAAVDGILRAVDPEAQRGPRGQPFATEEAPLHLQIDVWSNQVLYVKTASAATAADELAGAAAIRRAVTTNTSGIVWDLRRAGGGNLDALDAMGGLFFEEGVELYQLRNGPSNVVARHNARAPGPVPRLPPVMLLVDDQTHGTSETLAALLQHHPSVMVLGTPTRGSAAWRERVPLSETEDAFITTAWLTPTTGVVYRGCGVFPDVLVITPTNTPAGNEPAPDTQTVASGTAAALDGGAQADQDTLVRRAVDILRGLQALRQP